MLDSWPLLPLLSLRKMLFLDPRFLMTSADGKRVAYSYGIATVILYPTLVIQCLYSFALHPISPLLRLPLPHHAVFFYLMQMTSL